MTANYVCLYGSFLWNNYRQASIIPQNKPKKLRFFVIALGLYYLCPLYGTYNGN